MAPVSLGRFSRSGPTVGGRGKCCAAIFAVLVFTTGCTTTPTPSTPSVSVRATADGVAFEEGGRPVLFYRSRAEAGREPWRVNYIHPLYSVAGAVLTEDAPVDHVHQRGLYWAWRRVLVDDVRVADGWVGDRIVFDVSTPITRTWPDGSAQVDVRTVWHAPVQATERAIIEENSTIRAYPVVDGRRRLEIEVRLRALLDGVQLAGTDDDKGYGGLSFRFANAPTVQLQADGRPIQATVAGMEAGDTVTFRWPSLPAPWPASIQVSCQVDGKPWTHWVLRQEPSMQNCAFPGRAPVRVPVDRVLVLRATLDIG